MKIANIDRKILHNFWTTWGSSMKLSGKMCFFIILKATKNWGFTFYLEDTFFKKPQGENWSHSRFSVKISVMIVDMIINKKIYSIVTELFSRIENLIVSLIFIRKAPNNSLWFRKNLLK